MAVTIYLHDGEDITEAIKRFNKKVFKEDILNEYRKHEYYLKPSDLRKEKIRRAKKMRALEKAKAAQRERKYQ